MLLLLQRKRAAAMALAAEGDDAAIGPGRRCPQTCSIVLVLCRSRIRTHLFPHLAETIEFVGGNEIAGIAHTDRAICQVVGNLGRAPGGVD